MLVSKDDSTFLLHLVIWLLFLFVCNTSILLDMQPVYHPKMLAATSCGKNLYASQHSESPMSQKATITHLTEPSTSQIFYPPLPFQQAVVTAHLLPLSTQHSHRDGEILVVEWLTGREGGEKTLQKGCVPKDICLHLSKVSHSVLLRSVVLTPKAASWLSIDESISKGQQV